MFCYRIIHEKHFQSPKGFGAKGAQWNPKGAPMIYVSGSVSLAMLEFICIKGRKLLESEYRVAKFYIKGEISQIEPASLPDDWRTRPHPYSTKSFGKRWIAQGGDIVKVPSARLPIEAYPEEYNLLINPLHASLEKRVEFMELGSMSFYLNDWS